SPCANPPRQRKRERQAYHLPLQRLVHRRSFRCLRKPARYCVHLRRDRKCFMELSGLEEDSLGFNRSSHKNFPKKTWPGFSGNSAKQKGGSLFCMKKGHGKPSPKTGSRSIRKRMGNT